MAFSPSLSSAALFFRYQKSWQRMYAIFVYSLRMLIFYASVGCAQWRLLCFQYVPLSRANVAIFVLPRTNTEWSLLKFVVGNDYHQKVNWLNFGRNWTRDKGQDVTENLTVKHVNPVLPCSECVCNIRLHAVFKLSSWLPCFMAVNFLTFRKFRFFCSETEQLLTEAVVVVSS